MYRHLWPSLALLLGCESWYIDNPANCMLNTSACTESERCNAVTQRCETVDCSVNTSLCTGGDICSRATNRCEPITFALGQPDSSANENAAYGMYSPQAATFIPDALGYNKVVVGDVKNHRVLIWNDVPTQNRPADAVIGMPNLHTLSGSGAYGGISESSLEAPWSVTGLGTRLIIGDQVYNRLLIWSPIPSQANTGYPTIANGLWGQINFELGVPHNGAQVNALGVSAPLVYVEPQGVGTGRFFVSDSGNNRVLLFEAGVPTNLSTQPSKVVGQSAFGGSTPGTSRTTLRSPIGAASDGTNVFITDSGNNRVMGYPIARIPAPGAAATAFFLMGQGNFNAGADNRGNLAPDNTSLSAPQGIAWCTGGWIFIADQGNSRILGFKQSMLTRYDPGTNPTRAEQAQLVLGQGQFSEGQPNRGFPAPGQNTLSYPSDVHCAGNRLIVADTGNNRTLIWSAGSFDSLVNGQDATIVLGQSGFTTQAANMPAPVGKLRFNGPVDVASDGTAVAVADTGNHRVLLWTKIPASGDVPPDAVLGQPDFNRNAENNNQATPNERTLSYPSGVSLEGGYLAVSDRGNNRVLIWKLPVATHASADFVVGQPNFSSSAPGTMPSDGTLAQPIGLVLSQSVLYVADSGLNRVLIYRSPFSTNPSVNYTLGQPNQSAPSERTLAGPSALTVSQGKLLVADSGNQRVLVWNTLPTSNYQPADVVIGQPDFTHAYPKTNRSRLNAPSGILVSSGRLYVAAAPQNRILFWKQIPTDNERDADGVIGQSDFFTSLPNLPDFTARPLEQLSAPAGMTAVGSRLFIADTLNNRVVVRALPTQ